ncbi:hypothetical protein D3C84_994180 [compost metagenome]
MAWRASTSPNPVPTKSTSKAAAAQAPRMIGTVVARPKRELWLSTRILVGPGVMEATNANKANGSNWSMEQDLGE